MTSLSINRREFLASAGGALALGCDATGQTPGVSIVVDPEDAVANSGPSQWATNHLRESLVAQGASVRLLQRVDQAPADDRCIIASGPDSPLGREVLAGARLPGPSRKSGT